MNRVLWFIICTVVGLELIAWGLLVPTHIRALDAKVLELTGASSPSLVTEGLSLVNLERTGPARILLELAERVNAPGRENLAASLDKFDKAHPRLKVWGGAALYLERVFEKSPPTTVLQSQPVIDLLVTQSARETLIQALRMSRRPAVLEILRTRELTNTVIFPPALSSSGQALDAAVTTTALLYQQDYFASALRNSIQTLATNANRGGPVEPLEAVYLELLSLGKRLDWGQLANLMKQVPDINALQETAGLIREREGQLPAIYSAIQWADSPHQVAEYLASFPSSGLQDLTFALRAGRAAVRELLGRQEPIHYPRIRDRMVSFAPIGLVYEPLARIATSAPWCGFVLKYGLCLLGALLVARALTYLSQDLLDEIVCNRPWLTGPQLVIGLCLLSLVLFSSESLVPRATRTMEMPIRIKFPVASAALRATIPNQLRTMSDKLDNFSTFSLLTFFIIQATIYVFCRMKLAEIRRQPLPSRLKLRLLENEEHLFDAGLYFGFVGTVISLILMSMGLVVKPSIMAAYSSTSFGVIFVSIVKIFHVRPYRRRLILDTEMAPQEVQPA